jgi:alkylation response protein AidB-like acyl-CoA dehydrogenase
VTESDADGLRDELRATVRRCLDRSDGPRPFLVGEPETSEPFDRKLWHVLTAEVGVSGLGLPEEFGGAGGSIADLAIVAEELGRALAPVPFLSTVAMASTALLLQCEDPTASELLTRLAEADATATLACALDTSSWLVDATAVRAEQGPDSWLLTGTAEFVVDGAAVDLVLVPASTAHGIALFAVAGDNGGLHKLAHRTLDLTRPLATLTFEAADARLIGPPTGAEVGLQAAVDCALVLLAAEQVGGAQRCLDEAVRYAGQRVQFDRPIGSFQAIKHALVNVLLDVEMARSAAAVAVRSADRYLSAQTPDNLSQLALAASLAKATCAEAYLRTAEETLHVHGGVGFTWEHDAHLHYRRAKAGELFLGTPSRHRDRMAEHAGLGTP